MLSSIWKYIKIIGGIIIAIGAAIIFFAFGRKGSGGTQNRKPEIDRAETSAEEHRVEAEHLDAERKEKEGKIEDIATDTRRKLEESKNKPEEPGDAGKSADELKKEW